jgi:pyruvate,water dikinase
LTGLVGPEDANLLIGNMGTAEGPLASLEPVLGLGKLARGDWTQEAYIERFGHRGPGEFELSLPRPAEDPAWIDQQISNFQDSPVDVMALVRKQQAAFDDALNRLQSQYPKQAAAFLRQIQESARRGRLRETARSAYIRDRWLMRLFALRVGELSGLGEDIFFLTLDEVLGLLKGRKIPGESIAVRRETYQQFKSLPSYPSIILGQFDPHQWVADPNRRNDIFSSQPLEDQVDTRVIEGSPGSAGQVEGTVRCLENPEQGQHFQQGEILVAGQTDIAWTMIFPRAAAVITDIGAPLSHAAIVARELGIPAVVGCGDAMSRLKTGDRVRVDGGRGIVTILQKGD